MSSLTEILISHGLLPAEQSDTLSAGDTADETAVRALLASGVISELQFARARAEQTNLPFVELLDYPVDELALTKVPVAICHRDEVLPIGFDGKRLILAMVDPGNVFALDDVRETARMRVTPVVVERSDLMAAISRYHRADDELNDLTNTFEEEQAAPDDDSLSDAEAAEDAAPIVRFVNLLVSQAIQDKASDIHIEPAELSLRIRYRIDGVLHEMPSAPKNIQSGVISRIKIMSEIDIAERRKPQDGRMSVSHNGRKIDLRVAILPTVWGEKVVLRILDNATSRMSMNDLNMLVENRDEYKMAYTKPNGMILVTGPTGSGKSTTLYTTLSAISKPEINVITVEDPVEYRMPGINQVQVNRKAGLTFAVALRSILRSDPDVVLLGEIRDQETAKIAIEASLTGHLVLSTLHTNDAPSAMTRLVEMGIEPFLVGSAITCVVAQRLARRLCERCKVVDRRDQHELAGLGFGHNHTDTPPTIYVPSGCTACSHTGYRGRVAVHEVMTVSPEVERLTIARASSGEIAAAARKQGMITLLDDGWAKVRLGLTSIDEVLRVVA
ncbi:type II secretion system protein GspE [Cryobacterium sp. TMT1-3]|uniref:Type II secretion system protein GspE n=1 Tax=Cryobacterium luteum TaxID=1424661 RepID=A0A1H8C241_9MICO|nr:MULTISPECIES: ATPase, T2SS/T4P/T4SS family [Cryobacterium]TFB89201.1 type II secretion system protein GspE [Cryobacterium luteum]TFC27488.1 type II secretion system protein GspE [Cryobacterium sp. TMT1-3]SEM88494.1 type IV pilus assembly protein PilB [Cryobacterium luteum]